ncbi:MAG: hypothetical protein QCI00_00910 [Candidatus Thermoplasmatota archaeon]|nr:hypothetical protein [Candidatus Thermoplasmatota archaeon]
MKQKNKIIIFLFSIIALSSSASSVINVQTTSFPLTVEEPIVFAEYITTTWCPQCPIASQTLYELYQDLDSFYYVTLIVDKNELAQKRSRQFTNYAVPSVYFDGGYRQYIGNSGQLYDEYTNQIETSRQRTNRNPVILTGKMETTGEQQITLNISVTNTGQQAYIGRIRTYITEKESHWSDYDQNPYHFSLIDFALDQPIFIKKGETQTFETQWDYIETSTDQSNYNISIDNLFIITSISHWKPHFRSGFMLFPYLQFYLARFFDTVLILEP